MALPKRITLYVATVLVVAPACVGAFLFSDVGDLERPGLIAALALVLSVKERRR